MNYLQHWKYRRYARPALSLLQLQLASTDSATPSLVKDDSLTLSTSSISLLDAGFEYYIIIPAGLQADKSSLAFVIDATQKLVAGWQERKLPLEPTIRVLSFPTQIPAELAAVSRKLDWDLLVRTLLSSPFAASLTCLAVEQNEAATPTTSLNLYTLEEAQELFLA